MPDFEQLRFTKSHEWISVTEGGIATVGVTQFAVDQLTDIIAIEFPVRGSKLHAGSESVEIESVKAVVDVYSPLEGTVSDVNENLTRDLTPLSRDPYGEGWLFKMMLADPAQLDGLLTWAQYQEQIATH